MLAVSAVFDSLTGQLTITGDTNDNVVTTSLDITGQQLTVDVATQGQFLFDATSITLINFTGGNGNDTFDNQTDIPISAYGNAGNDTITTGGGDDFVQGGPGLDSITATGGNNTLYGGDDDDEIWGGVGNDTIFGGRGNDTLVGGDGDDLIGGDWGDDFLDGDLGNDDLRGYTGNDTLFGSFGDDLLYGQADNDTIFGEDGVDRLRGGSGNDVAYGGANNDYIHGDHGDDDLHGDDGNDTIIGFDGVDTINGDGGTDYLYGQNGNDTITGGDGNDFIRGGDGDDLINGLLGHDRVAGDGGNDTIYGGAGNDTVIGDDGSDRLYGESGDDNVYGGAGMDMLFGGSGTDSLWGGAGEDSLFGGQKEDIDQLYGEGDDDRFLIQIDDVVNDQASEDAVIMFLDADHGWSDLEIEVINNGLQPLHDRTQNTLLLKDTLPTGNLLFIKYADLGGALAVNYLQTTTEYNWNGSGWDTSYTYDREIRFAEWDETSTYWNGVYESTVGHELAHNWDSDLELTTFNSAWTGRWADFLALSGWTDSNPNDPQNYTLSGDGTWWYLSNSSFAETYGQTNPYEDSATIWEYYFSGQSTQDPGLQAKLDWLDQLFDDVSLSV